MFAISEEVYRRAAFELRLDFPARQQVVGAGGVGDYGLTFEDALHGEPESEELLVEYQGLFDRYVPSALEVEPEYRELETFPSGERERLLLGEAVGRVTPS